MDHSLFRYINHSPFTMLSWIYIRYFKRPYLLSPSHKMTCLALRTALPTLAKSMTPLLQRCMASAASAKKEGDISSVFVSLSGQKPKPLPARFAELKRNILRGREEQFTSSWNELLRNLKSENEIVAHEGPNIIPQIDFKDIRRNDSEFVCALKKRGVAVIRGIIPESEARQFKNDIEEYVQQNSSTKGMSSNNIQIQTLIVIFSIPTT